MSQPLPHPANAPAVLLTGVTGSLGGQLLAGLLRAWPDHHVLAPLRAPTAEAAALRLREAADFAGLGPAERMRLHTFAADLSAPMLGLPLRAWQQLADCTRVIYHLAASVDFDLPLAESRRANVDSTAELLRLAQLCAARHASEFRFNHVSTAYICGRREGRLLESELGVGQSFWNGYDQSKLESEGLVRAVMGDLRATVYRPSQVVGDAARGRIRRQFGFYDFLKLAQRDRMPLLVADAAARSDIVPSDHVCDAVLHLSRDTAMVGRTVHLAAGLAHSLSTAQLVELVYRTLDEAEPAAAGPRRRPRILPAHALAAASEDPVVRAYRYSPLKVLMRTYGPYLAYERDFAVDDTAAVLAQAGIVLPPMAAVLRRTARWFLGREKARTGRVVAPERQSEPTSGP